MRRVHVCEDVTDCGIKAREDLKIVETTNKKALWVAYQAWVLCYASSCCTDTRMQAVSVAYIKMIEDADSTCNLVCGKKSGTSGVVRKAVTWYAKLSLVFYFRILSTNIDACLEGVHAWTTS